VGTTWRDRWLLGAVGLVLASAGCSGTVRTSAPAQRPTGSTVPAGYVQLTSGSEAADATGLGPPPGQARQLGAVPAAASERQPLVVVALRPPAPSPFASTPGASGQAAVTVLPDRGELCVELTVAGLSQPTAAHLHEATGVGGDEVILALKAPPSGDSTVDTCVSASTRVLERIERSPSRFSISVKTATFPDGALRGPLG
jgi:hypothetical protein